MTETEFFRRTMEEIINLDTSKALTPDQRDTAVRLGIEMLHIMREGFEAYGPFETFLRIALGIDLDAEVDPIGIPARFAQATLESLSLLQDEDEPAEGTFTYDQEKELIFATEGYETDAFPDDIAKVVAAILPTLPSGSIKSDTELGKAIHRFVQRAYQIQHPLNMVVLDGRWYYLAMKATLSGLLNDGALTKGEIRKYFHRAKILRDAMRQANRGATGGSKKTYLRPDISDLDENTMYEIKSRTEEHQGFEELYREYIPRYNKAAKRERTAGRDVPDLIGGAWLPPPLYYDRRGRRLCHLFNKKGVIVYDVYPIQRRPDTEVVAAAVVTAAIANFVIQRLAEAGRGFQRDPSEPREEPRIVDLPVTAGDALNAVGSALALILAGLLSRFGVRVPVPG